MHSALKALLSSIAGFGLCSYFPGTRCTCPQSLLDCFNFGVSKQPGRWAKEAAELAQHTCMAENMWVVVENVVPFWVLIIIRHLIFRVP